MMILIRHIRIMEKVNVIIVALLVGVFCGGDPDLLEGGGMTLGDEDGGLPEGEVLIGGDDIGGLLANGDGGGGEGYRLVWQSVYDWKASQGDRQSSIRVKFAPWLPKVELK